MFLPQKSHQKKIPSRELTYPPDKAYLKMIFLFPRWDMLVSWRVLTKNIKPRPQAMQRVLIPFAQDPTPPPWRCGGPGGEAQELDPMVLSLPNFLINKNRAQDRTKTAWWFFTNPSEKYAQVKLDIFPKYIGVKIKHI